MIFLIHDDKAQRQMIATINLGDVHHFDTVCTILLEITWDNHQIWTQLPCNEARHRCSDPELTS